MVYLVEKEGMQPLICGPDTDVSIHASGPFIKRSAFHKLQENGEKLLDSVFQSSLKCTQGPTLKANSIFLIKGESIYNLDTYSVAQLLLLVKLIFFSAKIDFSFSSLLNLALSERVAFLLLQVRVFIFPSKTWAAYF